MLIVAFDIETDTTVDGRDPARTSVTAAAAATIASGAVEADEVVVFDGAEVDVLRQLLRHLRLSGAEVCATWNGTGFDLPMLERRLVAAAAGRLDLRDSTRPLKYPPLPGFAAGRTGAVAGLAHADICYAYEEHARRSGVTWSLKPVARSLGFDPVEAPRDRLHELDGAELAAYVASDAVVTAVLAAAVTDLAAWVE